MKLWKWLTDADYRQHPDRYCAHGERFDSDCKTCETAMDRQAVKEAIETEHRLAA